MPEEVKKRLRSDDILNPNEDKSHSVHQVHSLFFIIGVLCLLFVLNTAKRVMYSTPELTDKNLPFVGADAWKDLKILNDIGPKVTGTRENEVLAVNFLKKRIENIMQKANPAQNLHFDHQIVTGNFNLAFNPGMASVYRSVQNLVVKVEGESPSAVLLNCHFDTVFGSPGASDDGANCAIMLEILSIMSSRDAKSHNTIIFLFNGAEETVLKSAHGFVAHHKWAKDAKVLINLESAGSGGKEILFQSGPGNSWLINHYTSVKRPFAQVSSEEIFQSGVIPSDTDFRIFRDFGNIVGFDLAHFVKGYRYHTKYDHIDYLTLGNIQRTGENVLELLLSLSNGSELDNIEQFDKNDLAVYYDFLGIVFVNYTKELGSIINFIITILSIAVPYLSLKKATTPAHSKHILKETFLGLISVAIGFATSLLICYLTAYVLDKSGHSMTWFRNTFLELGIYTSSSVWFLMVGYDVIDLVFADKRSPLSLGLKVQARINGVNILWGILTIGMTIYGIRSAYLFMVILMINLFATITIGLLKLQNSVHKWLFVFLFGQIFITLWSCYLKVAVTEMFIPITGRISDKPNPDAIISVISCATTFFIVSYFIPLTQLLKGKSLKYMVIISIFLISVFAATYTNIGFPYQDESSGNPVVQRHHVMHTARTFYDVNGHVRKSDSGIIFLQWDRNAIKTIEGVTMTQHIFSKEQICNEETFCGMPIIISRMFMFGMQWLPASRPRVADAAKIDSHVAVNLGDSLVKHEFIVNSSKLMGIYVHPRNEAELVSWSLSDKPLITINGTYLVSVAAGVPKEPFKFDMTFRTKGDTTGLTFDITLVTFLPYRPEDFTEDYKKIIMRFPSWTFPVTVLSDVTSYQY